MNDKLFSNPGSKLKTLAIVYFWITSVSCIICAFAFGWVEVPYYSHYSYSTYREFAPVWFFSFLLAGTLGAYLTALPLYGFGELVEKTTSNNELLKNGIVQGPETKEEVDDALRF